LDNNTKIKIEFEISQIEKLLDSSKPVFDLCKLKTPDFIEMSAIALILHSFYNGIENILVLTYKNTKTGLPVGTKWHIELLERVFTTTGNGKIIFRDELREPLNEYLKFRHFIRHAYGFQLKWEQMENLAKELHTIWIKAKEDITKFIGRGSNLQMNDPP
jgi:hypothetical protein